MNTPLISIVIPTYNRSLLLERAIKSIINQTYQNWEIIVIDNNSTDDTDLVLKKYKEKKILIKKINNEGIIAKSRNLGIKLAKGEYIAFLDSDDWWENKKIQLCMQIFDNNNIDLIYHNCFILEKNKKKKSNCRKLSLNQYEDLVINGNTIITSSVILNKKNIKVDLIFSEEIKKAGWEDYDLWLNLAKSGYKFGFIKDCLGNYYLGNDNFDSPKKVLENIDFMHESIFKKYVLDHPSVQIWWTNYTKGIAYYHLNDKSQSYAYFSKVLKSSSPLLNKFKALFYILLKLPKL